MSAPVYTLRLGDGAALELAGGFERVHKHARTRYPGPWRLYRGDVLLATKPKAWGAALDAADEGSE